VGSTPWHPMRRLDGPQSQSRYGEVKNSGPAGTENPTPVAVLAPLDFAVSKLNLSFFEL
jgi:hypothetical protein